MTYLLGYDIGSSSVKASLVDASTGQCVASSFYPKQEAPIKAIRPGWAEQHPHDWWAYVKQATAEVLRNTSSHRDIAAIGISYQMHGLVCTDKQGEPLRPAIIWCDGRAIPYGEQAFHDLGSERCLSHLLNSPGNFTASKLAWVKENEPEVFEQTAKVMLPGDYIALRMTGECLTTVSGLSEAMLWDFKENDIAHFLTGYYGFDESLLPPIVGSFAEQGRLSATAAAELGLQAGIPLTYRAGDQPNNALSLNVLHPGQIASTAGTSGVVYGINGSTNYDPLSRVNTFAHVNHSAKQPRLGILLCINGTGILNSWIRRMVAKDIAYKELDQLAGQVPMGADGIRILPFGNGAERMLLNRDSGCSLHGINFNLHDERHLIRAAQEGIVFAFKYGIDIMQQMGMDITNIHAGRANMFLSPVFRQTLANVTGATIHLFDTDGSIGAARGAGIGAGIYSCADEAFENLQCVGTTEPKPDEMPACMEVYESWKAILTSSITH
ncbi:MAG: FGGY family carbohydrate kinase [Bacteroidales bacterium]|nr:FGGY family carbohydrate kinase [Bacteroidales bacterium]